MGLHRDGRINNLTGIRGFAALWVAIFHFQTTPIVDALHCGQIVAHGAWGVDVFFVLSGLILAVNYAARFSDGLTSARFRDFIIKRLARIYPVHFVTFIAMLIAWQAMARSGYQFHGRVDNDGWTALCNLLMVHAWGFTDMLSWNTPSWSISAEWFAYLIVLPMCTLLLKKVSARYCFVIAFVLWVGFLFYAFALHAGDIQLVRTDAVLRIVPEFVAGYAAYRWVTEHLHSRGDLLVFVALSLMGAVCYAPPWAVPLLLPAVVLLMIGLYRGGVITDALFGNRTIILVGEISYSIYMTHLFVQIAVNFSLRHLIVAPSVLHAVIILTIEIVAAIVSGYAMYRLVEHPARLMLLRRPLRFAIS